MGESSVTPMADVPRVERAIAWSMESVRRLLLVDDDSTLRQLLIRILRRRYEVEVAGSIRDAVQRARDGSYDCILANHDVEGHRLGELLATLQRKGDVLRLIVMTGADGEPLRRLISLVGERHVLLKPFSKDALLQCVDDVARASAAAPACTSASAGPRAEEDRLTRTQERTGAPRRSTL